MAHGFQNNGARPAAHPIQLWMLFGMAAGLAAASLLLPGPWPAVIPLSAGGAVAGMGVIIGISSWSRRRNRAEAGECAVSLLQHDPAPCIVADAEAAIHLANPVAGERFGTLTGQSVVQLLKQMVANPAGLVARLQTRADARGAAREDVVTRRGHVRLTVHRVPDTGYLWRFEDLAEKGAAGRGAESLSLPMMTVGKSGTVLFMNDAMRRLTGGRAKSLDRIFSDLPLRSNGVHRIEGPDGAVHVRVVEMEGSAGRRELYLMPLEACWDSQESDAVDADGLEALPVAMMRVGPGGYVHMANRLARDLLGERAKRGARLAELLEGLGRPIPEWIDEAVSGRGLGKAQTLKATARDPEVFVQITLERAQGQEDGALLAVLNDATELKTLEAQFVQSQKMQAIGQLAGGVAHDFNNVLTAISGHCDLLLLRHAPDDPDYGDLVQINQNANRAASLVGQLLAFSRKQTLRLEAVDLEEALGELTHLLNRLVGEKTRLLLTHDPDLLPIRADRRQLEQVIMNLVVNARDAMPEGGEIRIETEHLTIDRPLYCDRAEIPAGNYVLVRVIDAGEGIPAENLDKIFEPFFSTKGVGEGTGLGLSTAYGIVKQTGGYIFAESAQGVGTTFTLFLPVFEQPEEPHPIAAKVPTLPGPARGEGVVLLVEDEAPVRAFASRALRMRGYTVIEAENAEEALRALEDAELKVDVFVTDVIMPGMDGPTWVRKALASRPDAKVVFVSGYAEESFSDAQSRIPNSVFLPKPFSLSDLAATVQGQIH